MTSAPVQGSLSPKLEARPFTRTLKRSLGAKDVLILTLSALSPAASVYITGSGILHMAGTGAAAAVLLGGAVIVLVSLLYAELGAAFPDAGGVYPGITRVLGPAPGFVAVTLGLVTAPAGLAFIALGFADYVRVLAPAVPKLPLALGALGAAALLAILNIRTNAWLAAVFLAAELLSLVVIVCVAGLHPVRGLGQVLLHPVMVGTGHALAATPVWTMALATISGAYACAGSGLAIFFVEEMRGAPGRIGWIVVVIGVIALIVVSAPLVLLTMSASDLAGTLSAEAPIAHYLGTVVSPLIAFATTLAVALAILNNVIASVLAFSRFVYSTGRDGLWPSAMNAVLSKLHRRFGSPWLASIVLALAAACLSLLGERRLLVLLSGEVFTGTMVVTSVLVGRRRGLTGASSFRSPLFPLTPLVGFGVAAAFIAADWHDPDAGRLSLILLGAVAFCAFAYQRFRSRSRG